MTISEVDSKESGLTYGLTYGMTTVNIRFNIIFTAFSTFCYVGESVSMAICANMSFSYEEKLFKLRSKVKGVPHGYVETYQLSGINFPRALRELDSMYQDNSDDQNALFEKLSLCKPIDLYNYDSIQEVLLTIRKIENHCGSNKKSKAGEISMYTNIKKTTNTTAAIRLVFAIDNLSLSKCR
jgi:hypothetical protein